MRQRRPDGAFVAVTDDGRGVAEGEISAAGQALRAGDGRRRGQGAGLGLSIVQTLARRLGATLTLASPAPGARSGFEARLTWPAQPPGRRDAARR